MSYPAATSALPTTVLTTDLLVLMALTTLKEAVLSGALCMSCSRSCPWPHTPSVARMSRPPLGGSSTCSSGRTRHGE